MCADNLYFIILPNGEFPEKFPNPAKKNGWARREYRERFDIYSGPNSGKIKGYTDAYGEYVQVVPERTQFKSFNREEIRSAMVDTLESAKMPEKLPQISEEAWRAMEPEEREQKDKEYEENKNMRHCCKNTAITRTMEILLEIHGSMTHRECVFIVLI